MNILKYTFLASLLVIGVSCKEKTAETSKHKEYISELNASLNSVDSAYNEFAKINHEALAEAHKNGKEKFSLVKKTVQLDSIDAFYDNNMNTYKSIYVKGINNAAKRKEGIEKEYEYSKSQINALIPNLIQENFSDDSATIYFNSEKEALVFLQKEIDNYNSMAVKALTLQDSLNSNLDSLLRKYDKNAH